MTITANSHKVDKNLVNKAVARATDKEEKVAIVSAIYNDKPMQVISSLADYEASPNRDNLEVILVIDENGNRVE